MIIVSDTGPIITLLKIHKLEILQSLFGEVNIPLGVYQELIENPVYADEIRLVKECQYINCVKDIDMLAVEILRKISGLDKGESEAIVLSRSIKDSLLIIDEKKGRTIAEQLDVNITGSIGILILAARKKLLSVSEIENCILILRNNGRFISKKLYESLMIEISKN